MSRNCSLANNGETISKKEAIHGVHGLKSNKAIRPDELPGEILKLCKTNFFVYFLSYCLRLNPIS